MSAMSDMQWNIAADPSGPRYIVRFSVPFGGRRAFADAVVDSPILTARVQERLMGIVATMLELERASEMRQRRKALARIG